MEETPQLPVNPSPPPPVTLPLEPVASPSTVATTSSEHFLHGWVAKLSLGIVIAFVLVFGFSVGYSMSVRKNSLVIANQPYSLALMVKRATLSRGGFVVIRTASRTLQVVAKTEYLPADEYNDIPVDRDRNNNLTPRAGDTLVAVIFEDTDGDFQFTQADAVAKDFFGNPISVPFKIRSF
ncbi:hypothetical protein HY086_03930 [Candidatus Gottesmanbacteria bacterium]|nr:hypothetical protein [Candidatus Gottesmanbacteria bacterium]